ncbi:MAG: TRAP transporter large permease [Thalassobaculum sp.]|uniref:TRAP transporter large permease n=1 Tax=Thalassobaculum sp. TaxID=2022740 RepID=UPI0032EF844D
MTGIELGLAVFAGMLALMALRMPIGVAMMVAGGGGFALIVGWTPLIAQLKSSAYYLFSSYSLTVIPLFLLMGQFATKSGLSRGLFGAANAWLGHRPGGIAMAAIGGCGLFGAICGSSLATAATMGQVALPELKRYHYSGALATGSLAAGGTLGILIPPSVILVIYAILTEQNIAKMFLAAFIPGILAAFGYLAAIAIYVRLYPEEGPAGPEHPLSEKLRSLIDIWPAMLIFTLVIGGIYTGVVTPTEAAAFGAAGTGLLAVAKERMGWQGLKECLLGAAEASAMIFLILFGAELFNGFLALTRMPDLLAELIGGSGQPPLMVLVAMLVLYLALGCVMDSLSMILLTIPIFFPVIMALDFGLTPEGTAIWFGVIALVVVEVGLITPPVGMNVFIINSMARDVPMLESFRGVLPFLISDGVRVVLLIAFPSITLWLVGFLG